jgi:glucosamine--fructose-6-phosphate aminotransferase (isomerizing)
MAAENYQPLVAAVQCALKQLQGTYGIVVMFRDWPEVLIAAKAGSPLIIGVGEGEHFIASDGSPLAGYTDKIVFLAENELAVVTADSLRVIHRDQGHVNHSVQVLEIEAGAIDLGGFPHYMLKEIFEQPDSIKNAMRGRLDHDAATARFGGLNLSPQQLRSMRRCMMTACGTSWHAALVGEYQFEAMARMPVEVDYASELRYRNPPLDNHTLVFTITQSGETADTLAALRETKRKGCPTLGICNVVGSTIAQESDGGVYLRAGPEIGVASTKAFTSQCTVLAMLALYFGRLRDLSFIAGREIIANLEELPDKVRAALACNDVVKAIAQKYAHCETFLYLGRQFNFPTALEGALKLKEISYIHAEGYPAAEMKHGPIALVDRDTPSVFLMPQGQVYDKVMSNVQEIKARGGPVIAVVGEGDTDVARLADDIIEIPAVEEYLQPIVSVIPLQLLAYHIAVARGCDVDKPRNLAKSVTVE